MGALGECIPAPEFGWFINEYNPWNSILLNVAQNKTNQQLNLCKSFKYFWFTVYKSLPSHNRTTLTTPQSSSIAIKFTGTEVKHLIKLWPFPVPRPFGTAISAGIFFFLQLWCGVDDYGGHRQRTLPSPGRRCCPPLMTSRTATDREETRCDNSICEITCPFSRTRTHTHTHKWFVTQVRHPRRCCLIWRRLTMTDKLARYRLWLSEQLRWLMVKIWRKYFFLNLFYQTRLNVKIWHQSDSCRGVLNYATCLTLRSVFSYSCNKSGWGRTLLGTEEHKIDSFASYEMLAQYRRKRIFAEKLNTCAQKGENNPTHYLACSYIEDID